METAAKFGDIYFYDLGLNRKMCSAIQHVRNAGARKSPVWKLFYFWAESNCSAEAYEKIVYVMNKRPEYIQEFTQVFQGQTKFR